MVDTSTVAAAWIEAVATAVLAVAAMVGFWLTLRQLRADLASRVEEAKARGLQAEAMRDEAKARGLQAEAIRAETASRKNSNWLTLLALYEGETMAALRTKAAQHWLDDKNHLMPTPAAAAWRILDFFESVAYAVEKDRLDINDVWHTFYEPISMYTQVYAAALFREPMERKDATIYQSLRVLLNSLERKQESEGGSSGILSEEEVKGFFETEAASKLYVE